MVNTAITYGGIIMTLEYRQKIINQIKLMLGDQMIDLELDPEHYSTALDLAFDRYRQRSGNADLESYLFLRLEYEVTEYYLPTEVVSVRQIFRRGTGETTGGTQLDPFSLSYTNMYLLQAGAGGGYSAGLLTFELFYQYLTQAGRMFGRDINFTFDPVTKKLSIVRKPTGGEAVVIWCYMYRPDETILQDPWSRPWIREYALAWAKFMLGEAYSKFTNGLAGPQGGVTLKGDALKQEATALMEKLEKDIDLYIDGGPPLGVIIG